MVASQLANIIPLNKAPFDCSLYLYCIEDKYLAEQLQKMGLYIGNEVSRMDEAMIVQPIRVRTRTGEVVLGGGMGMKTIVHLDDNRRIPLLDMEPGESGHIEGTTGGRGLTESLETLGIRDNEMITLIRKLPPMEYTVRIDHKHLQHLTEGDAARIWGGDRDRTGQFSFASKRHDFQVEKLLGGIKATSRLKQMDIKLGTILTLESVGSTQTLQLGATDQLVISSPDGLHLHLPEHVGNKIFVRSTKL